MTKLTRATLILYRKLYNSYKERRLREEREGKIEGQLSFEEFTG